MTLDFKNIDLSQRPQLILRNLDGVAFGTLGSAFNIKTELKLSEVSELTFEVPAYDNGEKTPFYDEIKSMNIIDLKDYGQFILKSAVVKSSGIKEIKQCTCCSLEIEMTFKQFFVPKGTYNFWNPVSPSNTILGMIIDTIPYWSLGSVDPKLIGKYRTFEANNSNIFDFIKNTAQSTYDCLFTFDTYNRKINIIDATSIVPTSPVYLSHYNLIKELEITEDTSDITTCIEAHGADDVTIRSVNPLGTNKIYNLDYYMTETNLSPTIISKWNTWKTLFESRQLPYYNLKIEESNQSARLLTEKSVLTDMRADLKKLENLQAVSIQYLGEHPNDPTEQAKLTQTNADIVAQKIKIRDQESYLNDIESELNTIKAELSVINNELAFDATFTKDEMMSLSKYIKEGSIQESSFVISKVQNYNSADVSSRHENSVFSISNSVITNIPNEKNKEIYSIVGGQLTCPLDVGQVSADIVRGSMERTTDGKFVFSGYLNRGVSNGITFPSGNISATGACGSVSMSDTDLSFTASNARVYFTQNATEYEARSVQFDLYDYAKQCLNKLSTPSYTFNVKPANFIALEDFVMFKNSFALGNKVYLDIGDNKVLQPITIGVNIDFEDYTNFLIEFSNGFKTSDSAFQLVDILGQSISMGRTLASSKYSYASWVDSGASSNVKNFMDSALDVAKNAVLSSTGQAISWDQNGMRFRKWNADKTDYEPEQMWAINNSITMTDDNWASAKMAIGKFTDSKHGDVWGVNAGLIAGHHVISNSSSTSCLSLDGKTVQFNFDAAGAFLNNATMVMQKDGGGQLLFDPRYGIVGGQSGIYSMEGTTVFPSFINESGGIILDADGMPKNANFFLDLNTGNPYFRGTVIAKDGKFTGEISAKDFKLPNGDSYVSALRDGKIAGENIDAKGINIKNANGETVLYMDETGIHWTEGNEPVQYQFSIDGVSWHDTMQTIDKYRRDSTDGGNTWGSAYQFVGTDGVNGRDGSDGTDGDPKGYLQSIKVTEITQDNVKSALIEGAVIRGGKIESETTIDVGTNAKIGEKLIIRGDNLYNGVEFCHDDGSMIAEIYVSPDTARMDIVSTGNLYINGEEYSPYGKFG